jgi:hypothetical protein
VKQLIAKLLLVAAFVVLILALATLSFVLLQKEPRTPTPFAKAVSAEEEAAAKNEAQILSFAVLKIVKTRLTFMNSTDHLTAVEAACDLRLVATYRAWARTLTDERLKAEYYGWLDEAEREIRERTSYKKDVELDEVHKQLEAAEVLMQDLPQPPDPKEHCIR